LLKQTSLHGTRTYFAISTLIEVLMSSLPEAKQGFSNILLSDLEQMDSEEINQLPFGVVGLSSDGLVEVYNATESRLAGLPADTVMGMPFFLSVAQCMNNFMVAQRLTDEAELDTTLPYVLTFRMRPTPVTLRLLKSGASARSYVLIQR
jgi:photoactive yellow protein